MDPTLTVVLALVLLFGLLIAGVSVALALAASGIVGLLILNGPQIAGNVIAGTSYTAVAASSLIVVPMFILMGMLTLHSGIAERLFAIASKLLRWLPGGLGVATVFAAAGFGAISGSSLATVATLGRTCITEMMRHGYQRALAAATVAVSGTLAVLIPPSVILVLYGVITGESVGLLLIAGIIPGVLSAIVQGGSVSYRAWRKPALVSHNNEQELALAMGGASPTATVDESAHGVAELPGRSAVASGTVANLRDGDGGIDASPGTRGGDTGLIQLSPAAVLHALGGVVCLFTIVVGGIYTGMFTPTESASIGAFAAFILLCLQYARRWTMLRSKIADALRETASLNASIFLILVGAGIFSYFLVTAGVPVALTEFVLGLELPPLVIVAMLLAVLIPAGMFLDSISLLVITAPLVYEPITSLGFDGIWLGILIVKLIEIGMITPPVGMNAFVAAGTTPGLRSEEVFRGILPFYIADIVIVALIFAVPALVTWLPMLSGA